MIRTLAAMGTVVSIEADAPDDALERALGWFREVEKTCSRFDAASELRNLREGPPAPASTLLFEAVAFAVQVAEATGGAFDPTVGGRMAARGYNRHYVTGAAQDAPDTPGSSFRDIELDAEHRSIRLKRAMTLDLGGVAKGLAVDAAARELEPYRNFCIDAGGDIYCGGASPRGDAWRIGIRHPRDPRVLLDSLQVSDCAVCTSGDYERGAHIIDPRDGCAGPALASATVIAPTAMLADALATAAFVLGAERGIALLEEMEVEGLLVTAGLQRHATRGFGHA